MGQITNTGYVLTAQNQWFDRERQMYLDIDPNWNLDESTPDGVKLQNDSEIFGNLDELAKQSYDSKDPSKVRGLDADILCAITGTIREDGTPGVVTLTLTGVAGTVVHANSLVENSTNGSRWQTNEAVTISGAPAMATVTATCTTNGPIQSAIGQIDTIVSTIGGWQGVTNPSVPTLGTDRQSDTSLLLERERTIGRTGQNQVDSTLGAIFAVADVRHARIYENDDDQTDVNGLRPHATAVIIDGGDNTALASAIYSKRSSGGPQDQPVSAPNRVTVTVQSPRYPSQTQDIKFSRPDAVDVNVAVTIDDDGSLPANASELITTAIIDYAQGNLELPGDPGFNRLGFTIAEDVPHSRIYTPINYIIGQYGASSVTALTLNGSATTAVDIPFNSISRWAESNITVTIV